MPAPAEVASLVTDAAGRIHRSPATGTESMLDARADAVELLDIATDGRGADVVPTRAERRRFDALLARRLRGEPMALIIGHVDFMGLHLGVRPGVFAPRQSSGIVVMLAVSRLRQRQLPTAVDVATGAGPIALAIARGARHARVYGTDIAADAVEQARANARANGLRNVHFRRGDVLGGLPRAIRGGVDVITAHPPYVPSGELGLLPDEVANYEPEHTLTDGSPDGLELVRRLAEQSADWLRPGGWLLVELSPDRVRGATAIFRRHLVSVHAVGARGDVTRVVTGRRARNAVR
jgi:release factor glutamine methyltransferase